MASWRAKDAKARFSELVEASLKEGPQIITRRGVEVAVLLSLEEWKRLQASARPSLKAWLLGPGPRWDDLVPPRRRFRRRPIVRF
ncbi:MAG: type II toxin-antitoxin system Phd/YefM family antitoxin [Terriglobales bacterium]